jgi:hypothetical protein
MSRSRTFLAVGLTAMLIPACSDGSPVGVEPGPAEPQIMAQASGAAAQSAPDLGGSWNWSNEEVIRMPEFLVPMLGITPEGPNTLARCKAAGTMTLVQTGAEFSGTAMKTFDACQTKGGQSFQRPASPHFVEDGRISGKSAHFSFSTPIVTPCPHHAVISAVQDGVALALSGTGHCFTPGHPRSESPLALNPPPGGTSTTVSWEAWRP